MSKGFEYFRNMLIILLCSVLIGYLLLVIAFCIPQGRIFTGLANSVSVLERDIEDEVVFGYPSSRLDIFSDGAILNATLHSNDEGPLRRAVACYQYVYTDLSRAEGFIAFFEPREPDGSTIYIRYWHGILAVLKPLFLFFNYSDIRMLNCIGQAVLIFLTAYSFVIRGLKKYIPALFVSYFFLMPFTLPMSIQYSPVFYIGFLSLTCIFVFYDKLKDKKAFVYLFLITGILTSYMDLLTYPMFTLGIPLVGLLAIDGEKKEGTFVDELKRFVSCGISWGMGYALMWLGKILIAVPFFGIQAISDAAENAGKRSLSGAASEGITYMEALGANLFMYKNSIFKIILVIYTLICICLAVRAFIKGIRPAAPANILLFAAASLIPFAWYFVTTEHAQVHAFMTYKNLAVTVFAYCAMLASLTGHTEGKEPS